MKAPHPDGFGGVMTLFGQWFPERPNSGGLPCSRGRSDYCRQVGALAKASIRPRITRSSSWEGWFALRRTTKRLALCSTRPATLIKPKRMALSRLEAHSMGSTRCFMMEFRLKARTAICHQAALAPNLAEGSLPPARSSLSTLCTSSPLPSFPRRTADATRSPHPQEESGW